MSQEGLQHSLNGLGEYPLYTDLSKTPGRFITISSLSRAVALLMVSGVIALAMLGYATGALADDPFDKVKVRTWNTKDNPDSFPEMTDRAVALSWLEERPSHCK